MRMVKFLTMGIVVLAAAVFSSQVWGAEIINVGYTGPLSGGAAQVWPE